MGHHQETPATILCAGTIPGANFRERVAAASDAGYSGITLFPEQYLDARQREKLSTRDMRSLLADHELVLAAVDPLLDWYGGEASRAEQLLYEMASELGAAALNAAPAFAPDLPPVELATRFAALCQRAAAYDLRVDLEVLPWSRVGSYAEAFEILRLADADNSGITLDCLHFFRCGDTVDTLRRATPELLCRISNIQLCDIPAQPQSLSLRDRMAAAGIMLATGRSGMRVMGMANLMALNRQAYSGRDDATTLMQEATCNRLVPGAGAIPLRDLLSFLGQTGIQAEFGLEVFSLHLNRLPAREAALQCMSSWQQLYRSLEV